MRRYFLRSFPIACLLTISTSLTWIHSFIHTMNECVSRFTVRCNVHLRTPPLSYTTHLQLPRCRWRFNLRFVAFAPCVHNLIPYSFWFYCYYFAIYFCLYIDFWFCFGFFSISFWCVCVWARSLFWETLHLKNGDGDATTVCRNVFF